MGKGSPSVTNTAQTYMANPTISGAGQQAIAGAQAAAASPFSMPVAPVAGLTQDQLQSYQNVNNAQGFASPLFAQSAGAYSNAAAPINTNDINAFYNPMAANVTSQLQNIYGEQNAQNQGQLTQQAGGVGADRIAVGMGDLANQQTLAAGQTYSNLYQNALQAAEFQKQQSGSAGAGFANLGATGTTNALNAANSLNQMGVQQQSQNQALLNAPYQNQLAQIAYQFQTPQYLAGITGGLAGAFGGTTTGNQQSTPAYPSPLTQVAGLATAGAGLAGAFNGSGGAGNGTGGTGIGPTSMNGGLSLPTQIPGFQMANARGGAIKGYDDGGSTDQTNMPAIPGVTLPKIGGLEPIPTSPLPMTQGHSGPLTGGINLSPPSGSTGSSSASGSIGNDISTAISVASKIAPFLMAKRGGGIPHYDAGGPLPNSPGPDFDPSRPIEGVPAPMQAPWPFNSAHNEGGNMVPNEPPINSLIPRKFDPDTSFGGLGNMFGGNKAAASSTPPPPAPIPDVAPADSVPLPRSRPSQDVPKGAIKVASHKEGNTDVNAYVAPQNALPYPDALKRDAGQDATRSPWMALVKAGAAMASTPGPIGVALAHGLNAGADTLAGQRKELRSEQELNDKAQKLYQDAQQHLDKYNKMTPYERANIALKNKELDQSGTTDGVAKPITEMDVARVIDRMRGSPGSPYATMPYDQLRQAAINAIKGSRGHVGDASVPLGTPKEFDDGHGGKVTGYWNGTTYAPKAP